MHNTNISVKSHTPELITVELGGEIDASRCEEMDSLIFGEYEAMKGDMVLDCAALQFIDSTIIGEIVRIYKRLTADGKKLALINLQPRIRKLFEICALDKVLELR